MGKKKSKAKRLKWVKRVQGVLPDLTIFANLAGYSPASSSPLSRLTLETDPAAAARRVVQLKKWERRSREQWPTERQQLLDAAQRARNVGSKVLLRRSG